MTESSLVEVCKIVDSFFNYFEGNFLLEHFARNYYGKHGFKRILSTKERYNGIEYLPLFHAVLQLKGILPLHK